MCLYPKLIINPKYKPNKKNNYNAPQIKDKRTLYVPVGCTKCMECLKQRARGWKLRLLEEIKQHQTGSKHFITLTLSNESITQLSTEIDTEGYERDNAIATLAMRRFLERWRAKHGKSVKHWFVTELGHQGTENIHLHGIIFTEKTDEIAKLWKYGYIWQGTYVNEATVNYIIKYCTKQDLQHTQYKPKILTSAGIGAQYTHTHNAGKHRYKAGATQECYITRQGYKIALPAYWRNKIYSDDEREKLWLEKLDKQERWVDGSRISIKHGDTEYYKTLTFIRKKNQRLGYGNDEKDWDKTQYEHNRRNMLHGRRTSGNDSVYTSEPMEMAGRRNGKTPKPSARITKWIAENVGRTKEIPTG